MNKFIILTLLMSFTGLSMAESTSVEEQLELRKKEFSKKAPEQVKQDYERGIEYVAASGILEKAINTGDIAPEFELPNAVGKSVTLSKLLEDGPVVLVWYRGGWCPYCNIYLHALQEHLPAIKEAGAQLVAISPELPDKTLTTQEKNNLEFHVLSDAGQKTASDYGIVFTLPDYVIKHYDLSFSLPEYNGDNTYTLPLSASYVIGQDGKVAYAYLEADYRKRAPIEDLVQTVKDL